MSELGCEGTIGSSEEMILVGPYQAKHFIRIIRKYIEEYVRCDQCKGLNSSLEKEKGLTYMKCMKCGASRVVKKIEGHFTAKKRGQRRRDR